MSECQTCGIGIPRGRSHCRQHGIVGMCSKCGNRPAKAKGLCNACYVVERRKKLTPLTAAQLLATREDWEPKFWERVVRGPVTECWGWSGTRSKGEYGMLGIRDFSYGAHRLSYLLEHGEPQGEVIRHVCDNPSCVNPLHLVDSTQKENMEDAKAKGRLNGWPKGKKRPGQSGSNHWKKPSGQPQV